MRNQITGHILYEGPSLINRVPIVAIATGALRPSENPKTGPMIQCYIMVADAHPAEATKKGYDEAICGQCEGREACKGWCYVALNHGVSQVWHQLQAGRYSPLNLARKASHLFRGRHVRFGAYGDPLAVPPRIWGTIAQNAAAFTGYTHQWLTQPKAHQCRDLIMASCDNPAQQSEAASRGWSTFRVTRKGEGLVNGERRCVNETTGLQCIQCGICNGRSERQRFVAITVHGAKAGRF